MAIPKSLHKLLLAIRKTPENHQVDISGIPNADLLAAMKALESLVILDDHSSWVINPKLQRMLSLEEIETVQKLIEGLKQSQRRRRVSLSKTPEGKVSLLMRSMYPPRERNPYEGGGGGGGEDEGTVSGQTWDHWVHWYGVDIWLSHSLINDLIGSSQSISFILIGLGITSWIAGVIAGFVTILRLFDQGNGSHIVITWIGIPWFYSG